MNTPRRLCTLVTTLLLTALAFAARLSPLPLAQADAKPAPLDMAHLKALWTDKCASCHQLYNPQVMLMSREGWQRTVNRMMTRDGAHEFITNEEAAQIVDYLATFAPPPPPKPGSRPAHPPGDPWATDALDVWTVTPSQSRVFNFEGGPLASALAAATAGAPGPAATWHNVTLPGQPDGTFVKVNPVKPAASRFALLLDRADTGRNLDASVRFQIIAGRVSPSVGIAFGFVDPRTYSVLRLDARRGALSVLKIAEPTHTVLQETPLAPAPAAASPIPPAAPAFALAPGWHTLRLLVSGGQIRGWLDGTKRISTHDDAYAGGRVALWSQGGTIAAFDDWLVDFYDTPAVPPSA